MLKRMFSKSSLRKQGERRRSVREISTSESEHMTTEQEGSMGLCLSSADLPVTEQPELGVIDGPVTMTKESTTKPPGSPITVSCAKSIDTPTTADLSWGGESSDSTAHVETADTEESQLDVPVKWKREQSKMERIKAKAIKSVTKELGVDEKMLADALGLSSSPDLEGKKSSIKAKGLLAADVTDPHEISQMRYLAKTLGLPPSFFGITADNEGDPNPTSSSGLEKEQVQENLAQEPTSERDVATGDPESSAVEDANLENNAKRTSSFRKAASKPQPTTDDERRQAKDDAVTRLNRMKAKAIKSATKTLGVDENNLSAAVGVNVENYENKTSRKNTEDTAVENYEESPEEMQFIADTLGLPVALFGIQGNQDKKPITASSTQPLPGSLAAALGMKTVETPEQTAQRTGPNEPTLKKTESSASQGNARSLGGQPQAGSLAAALGMAVDDSEAAPPVRTVIYESPTTASESPAKASESSAKASKARVDPPPKSLPTEFNPSAGGSLAAAFAALGLNFNPAPTAPEQQKEIMKPHARSPSASQSLPKSQEQTLVKPQEGSLADALGMGIDASLPTHQAVSKPRPGSVADALGLVVSPAPSTSLAEEFSKPQPGSLADALGMFIETSPSDTQPHEHMRQGPPSTQYDDIMNPRPGSLADALGMNVGVSGGIPQEIMVEKPLPGSLADALGMSVGTSPSASGELPVGVGKPRAGSLADALGMSVSATPQLSAPQQDDLSKPRAGSLADALGMSVSSKSTASGPEISKPRPRSLADALGMSVSPSLSETQGHQPTIKPTVGSLADALGMSIGPDLATPHDQEITIPQRGSLADALGMSVGPSRGIVPERKKATSIAQEQGVSKPQSGSLADALGISVSPTVSDSQQVQLITQPLVGSLADALGMSIAPATYGTQEREINSPDVSLPKSTDRQITKPLAGSLADALGLTVSSSPTVGQEHGVSRAQPGSLADALGMQVSSSPSIPSDEAKHSTSIQKARAGSLAAALGMKIDNSDDTGSARMEQPLQGSLAAALGMKVSAREMTPIAEPRPGSLAAALGMSIDPSVSAPVVRTPADNAVVKHTATLKAQPGSLAAALGISVGSSSQREEIRSIEPMLQMINHTAGPVLSGSLAAALGMPVGSAPSRTTVDTADMETYQQPRHGSLAEALGMKIATPSTTYDEDDSDDETGSEESGSESEDEDEDDTSGRNVSPPVTTRSAPQPGTLAAALGMMVEPAVSAPPTQQSVTPFFTSEGKSTLFGRVFSTVVAKQAKSSSNSSLKGPGKKSSDVQSRGVQQASLVEGSNVPVTVNQRNVSAPQPGSLAAALGMSVSQEQATQPDTSSQVATTAQPGSLAAALGVPVRSIGSSSPEILPGSLAAALGMSISQEQATQPDTRSQVATTAQPGSLAAALGVPVRSIGSSSPEIQPGSLAAALGMRSSNVGPSAEPTAVGTRAIPLSEPAPVGSRALPAEPSKAESLDEFSKIYTMGLASETEVMLRVELASAKAEAAGAVAYGKALEKQIAQMSKAYVEKLAELQQQIASYQKEVTQKSREIECLETEVVEEQQNYDLLMKRLDQTTERLTRTQTMMDETDAMLQQEFAELRELKSAFERYGAENGSSSTNARSSTRTSLVTRDLQRTLEREGDRRQSLKARLQSLRQSHSNGN